MSGITAEGRSALEGAVARARRTLEEDLAGIAEGRLGIHRQGEIEDEASLRLSSSELLDRREVVAVVRHLRNEGESAPGAVERVIREACFTHLNRLVAIRIAEAIGLLMPSLVDGKSSRGFREVLEVAPLLASDPYGGYWSYLRLCADELAADAPVLFDPRNPLLALAPSPSALDELVSLLSDPSLKDAWLASDTLGWAYQFFNTSDERRQMREAGAPRTSRELAVRNQFFTPRYVVDFLVQNSLGRRLLEAKPESALIDDMPFLIDPPTEAVPGLELDEVLVLDPACGSGHFLLGAYDLLEKAWELRGVQPGESARRILPCLHGIDIDPRCAQVASAALVLRARRSCPSGDLPRPGIVTSRALPIDDDASQRIMAELPRDRQQLVARLRDALRDAPTLGSLLKPEQLLASDVKRLIPDADKGDGALAEMWHRVDALAEAEADVLGALERHATEVTSSAADRLFAAEATDAIRFVEAMRRRYDVVLMNPPFGQPIPATVAYIRSEYPESTSELYAAFVTRGLELTREGGLVGAITNRTGFFLSSLEQWRSALIEKGIVCLADLGSFVLQGAQVEVAAYVLGHRQAVTTFVRCLSVRDKEGALQRRPAGLVHTVSPAAFRAVPQTSFAYWIGDRLLDLFAQCEPFEANGRTVSRGLSLGDNFRFIRTRWEVRPRDLSAGSWVAVSKGGEYSPFFDDVHLVMDWHDADRPYRDVGGARIFNLGLQGRAGVYWPKRTTSLPSARPLPAQAYFEANSIPAFGPDLDLILGWANTRIFALLFLALVGAGDTARGSAAKDWITGPARRLPWVSPAAADTKGLRQHAQRGVAAAMELCQELETASGFIAPPALRMCKKTKPISLHEAIEAAIDRRETLQIEVLEAKGDLDSSWLRVYGLGDEALKVLDREIEPSPARYPEEVSVRDDLFATAYLTKNALTEISIDSELVDSRQEARLRTQVDFRSLEDLCQIFEMSPRGVVGQRRKLGIVRAADLQNAARGLTSYLVGVAFGRWDLRVAHSLEGQPVTDAFSPLPMCPPGMLVDDDGLPSSIPPASYPLELPPDRQLVDELGHHFDIGASVRRAAACLFEDGDRAIAELEELLGASLDEYLRRRFFKDHLARYSKSRRQAPIYWQLSVPTRAWSVWMYAPMISREALFAMARHAARRLAAGREILAALNADRSAGGRGRSQQELSARIADEEDLATELESFRIEAERVAGMGWEPDLDDGLVLCAAPLTRLLPGWQAAADECKNLKAGRYPWAKVSAWSQSL